MSDSPRPPEPADREWFKQPTWADVAHRLALAVHADAHVECSAGACNVFDNMVFRVDLAMQDLFAAGKGESAVAASGREEAARRSSPQPPGDGKGSRKARGGNCEEVATLAAADSPVPAPTPEPGPGVNTMLHVYGYHGGEANNYGLTGCPADCPDCINAREPEPHRVSEERLKQAERIEWVAASIVTGMDVAAHNAVHGKCFDDDHEEDEAVGVAQLAEAKRILTTFADELLRAAESSLAEMTKERERRELVIADLVKNVNEADHKLGSMKTERDEWAAIAGKYAGSVELARAKRDEIIGELSAAREEREKLEKALRDLIETPMGLSHEQIRARDAGRAVLAALRSPGAPSQPTEEPSTHESRNP